LRESNMVRTMPWIDRPGLSDGALKAKALE